MPDPLFFFFFPIYISPDRFRTFSYTHIKENSRSRTQKGHLAINPNDPIGPPVKLPAAFPRQARNPSLKMYPGLPSSRKQQNARNTAQLFPAKVLSEKYVPECLPLFADGPVDFDRNTANGAANHSSLIPRVAVQQHSQALFPWEGYFISTQFSLNKVTISTLHPFHTKKILWSAPLIA